MSAPEEPSPPYRDPTGDAAVSGRHVGAGEAVLLQCPCCGAIGTLEEDYIGLPTAACGDTAELDQRELEALRRWRAADERALRTASPADDARARKLRSEFYAARDAAQDARRAGARRLLRHARPTCRRPLVRYQTAGGSQ